MRQAKFEGLLDSGGHDIPVRCTSAGPPPSCTSPVGHRMRAGAGTSPTTRARPPSSSFVLQDGAPATQGLAWLRAWSSAAWSDCAYAPLV
jgi:hypothetical protein